jgi:uncharacterized protein with von Willebrand factor type A (vWA) domain
VPFFRYTRWDGTQSVPDLDADDLLNAVAEDLLADGNLERVLRRLLQRGIQDPRGQRTPGLQDLLERLRKQRQQQLQRYNLDSVMEDIEGKLEDIIRTEREGIERRLQDMNERVERKEAPAEAREQLERRAQERRGELDQLPPDAAGRLGALGRYDFMDPEARRKFEELLASLQQQMLQPFLNNMQKALQGMSPQDMRRLREMLQDLNRMLRERAEGGEPDFQAFKDKWGDAFPGVNSLDELLEHIGRQMAQMQALMQSMSPGQRQQLQDMMRSLMMQDERLEAAMAQLAMHLEGLLPMDELRRRYDFQGDEDLNLAEARRLMEELQRLDQLERQLKGAQNPADLDKIDPAELARALGEETARDFEQLRELTRKLEEAGYLERKGDRLQLTARAVRKIGEKALRDVFSHLKRDRFGRHVVEHRGGGGDRIDEAKRYEFGDAFLLDLKETVMNALERSGPGTPVRLAPDDFEVFRTELSTQSATVVMLDMSRSMLNNGCYLPAKKVALALDALIRGQFPRDQLSIVGFSLYAREFQPQQLTELTWSDWNIGTNMHAGFQLARRLLARHKGGNKQVIMITDGEPTAHMEGGEAEFSYPPTRRTLEETLKEVQRCTREGIVINTFMLDRSRSLVAFVEQMARINRGRAFLAGPERLGEYVLVDYVRSRRRAS